MKIDRKETKKQILVSIINNYWPSYEQMEHPLIKQYGTNKDGGWNWYKRLLSELQYNQLYDIIRLVAPEDVYELSLRIPEL